MSEYAYRDVTQQGAYYLRHVSAMTAEGLHDKSDIAAELAHRDIALDAARAESERLRALLRRVLSCGLCEEPRGIGFSPSKQELKASALVTDISAALAGAKK